VAWRVEVEPDRTAPLAESRNLLRRFADADSRTQSDAVLV